MRVTWGGVTGVGGDPNPRLHPLGVYNSAKVKKSTQQKLCKYGVSVLSSSKKDGVKLRNDNRQEKGRVASTAASSKDSSGRRKLTAKRRIKTDTENCKILKWISKSEHVHPTPNFGARLSNGTTGESYDWLGHRLRDLEPELKPDEGGLRESSSD